MQVPHEQHSQKGYDVCLGEPRGGEGRDSGNLKNVELVPTLENAENYTM